MRVWNCTLYTGRVWLRNQPALLAACMCSQLEVYPARMSSVKALGESRAAKRLGCIVVTCDFGHVHAAVMVDLVSSLQQ